MNKKNVFLAFAFSALLCASLAESDAIDAGGSSALNQRGLYNYDEVGGQQHSVEKRRRSIYRDPGKGMGNEKKKRTDWLDFAAADEVLAANEAQLQQKYQQSDNDKDDDVGDVNADAEGAAEGETDVDAAGTDNNDADVDEYEHQRKNKQLHKKLKMLGFVKVKNQQLRQHRDKEKRKEELQKEDIGMAQHGEDDDQPQ